MTDSTGSHTQNASIEAGAPWPDDVTHDRIVGDWHHYQRRRGHRASTDDVLTAALAMRMCAGRRPRRYLDLGCGVGSVLLTTTFATRPGQAVGIEAQAQSLRLLARTIRELPGDAPPISILRSDFREVTPAQLGHFDLVTGSPPYLPLGTGVLPADPQRAACRFELRGGIEEYLRTAAQMMSPQGECAMVFQTTWDERVLAAGQAAGLFVTHRLDAVMRHGGATFLTVYGFRHEPGTQSRLSLAIRAADGSHTDAYRGIRRELGIEDVTPPEPNPVE